MRHDGYVRLKLLRPFPPPNWDDKVLIKRDLQDPEYDIWQTEHDVAHLAYLSSPSSRHATGIQRRRPMCT